MKRFRFGWIILFLIIIFFFFLLGRSLGMRKPSDVIHVLTSRQIEDEQTRLVGGNTSRSAETTAETTEEKHNTETVLEKENGKLNVNTASESDLIALPGIGDVLARRIVEYREENGAFSSVDDLRCVDGIGEKKLDGIRDYVTVEDVP